MTSGHHLSLKSSIGISKVWSTLKRRFHFSSDVRFDVDVIVKKVAEDAGVIADSKEVTDMTTTDSKKVRIIMKREEKKTKNK